jgi:hypothetical protein
LAVVEEETEVGAGDRLGEVGVGEDDVGGLAAQLEGHPLQVARRGGGHDLVAHLGGARESDLVDEGVLGEEGAGVALAGEHVHHAGRVAGFLDEVGQPEGRQRGLLGGLQDAHAAGRQNGAQLPGRHQQREVPGDCNIVVDASVRCVGIIAREREAATY